MGTQPSDPDLNLSNNYGYTNYAALPPSMGGTAGNGNYDNYSKTDISAPTVTTTSDNPNYIDPKSLSEMSPQIRKMVAYEDPTYREKTLTNTTTNPNYLDPKKLASKAWTDDDPKIQTLIAWARLEHDGRLSGMAALWDQLVTQLTNLRNTVGDATNLLAVGPDGKGGWPPSKSEASRMFLQNVGKATYSISDWIGWAGQNAQAFRDVAKQAASTRKNMEDIYKNFVREYNSAIDKLNSDDKQAADHSKDGGWSKAGQWLFNTGDGAGKTDAQKYADRAKQDRADKEAVEKKYTRQAQAEMKKLADVYISSYFALNEGTTYKGPLKSESPLDAYSKRMQGLAAAAQQKMQQQMAQAAARQAAMQRQMQQQQQLMQQRFQQQQRNLNEQLQQKQKQLAANQQRQLQQQLQREQLREKERLAAAQRQLQQQQDALQKQIAQQTAQFAAQQAALHARMNALSNQANTGMQRFTNEQAAMRQRTNGLSNEVTNGSSRLDAEQAAMRQRMNGLNNNLSMNENGLQQNGGMPGRGMGGMMRPPQMGRPPANSGLRGRNAGTAEERTGSGRSPLGGRGEQREKDAAARRAAQEALSESEEYLGGMPSAPERLAGRLGGQQIGSGEITPPRPGLPGRSGPGGRAPGMPGAPRGRQLQQKDLKGRRQRMSDAEAEEDELFRPLSFMRPDLTGRNGLPEIDWEQVERGEVGVDPTLKGARDGAAAKAPKPGMAERLTGRSKRKEQKRKENAEESSQSVTEAVEELWTVETPDTIDTPAEKKVDEQRGRVLGSGG